MSNILKMFRKKNKSALSLTGENMRANGEVRNAGYTKRYTINRPKSWLSRESLTSTDSGIAYRRHPEDRRSLFSRPNSLGNSVACYGRYISLDDLGVLDSHEDLILLDPMALSKSLASLEETEETELSRSLASLERIESIQTKRLEVTRYRRKQMKSNKRKRLESGSDMDATFCHSMIEIRQSYYEEDNDDGDDMNQLIRPEDRAAVLRKSSIQKKSWEIRRQRKMMMKKRRSGQYREVYDNE